MVFGCKTVSVKQLAILGSFWHSWLHVGTMSSKRAVVAMGTSESKVGSLKNLFNKKNVVYDLDNMGRIKI